VRLRQLRGLALRRSGRIQEALLELEKLRADGHQDPETLGILAAAWTASYEASGVLDELERARDLYAGALEHTPTDTYVGINAAAKSVMLKEYDRGEDFAKRVLARLQELRAKRGGQPAEDYWERVTEPEALLILRRYEEALAGYHAARVAHHTETGSIASTRQQVKRLVAALEVPAPWAERLLAEFAGAKKIA
jgi:tetratricopeptide (TPR) repeat protein